MGEIMYRTIITTPDRNIHELDDFTSATVWGATGYALKRVQDSILRYGAPIDSTLPVGWTVATTHYGDDYDDRPPIGHHVHSSRD